MLAALLQIEWKTLLLGSEEWSFLMETGIRTAIMFMVILLSLRLLGKRGIKQLSVFELGVIIGLGSAAGDPMFYKDVGLLPGILVFSVVLGLYRFITYLITKSNRFEQFVEGQPVTLIEEGVFDANTFDHEPIAQDEFYSQLRLNNVSHLGQVKLAILETNGEVSIFYYPDEEVRYGLPILPKLCNVKLEKIAEKKHYACDHCGTSVLLAPAPSHRCPSCGRKKWVIAINEKRIA